MKSTMEMIEKNRAKLTLVADRDEFSKAIQDAYQRTKGRYNVPGFRKGKAPRAFIERYYGEGAFFEDAVDALYPTGFSGAVKEFDLQVVGEPDLNLESISKDDGLVMTATVYLLPETELGEYMGLTVTVPPQKIVSDDDINNRIEQARERVARFVEVERPAQTGDILTIDFAGFVDGVAFDGGTAENQTLTIGSNRFIPGFEEQLIGLSIGEEHEINVTFPDEYHEPSLASKDATFKVTINGIKEKQLPDVDDEFVKDVSDFDTLDEYKADIMAKLTEENKKTFDNILENKLIKLAADNAVVDIPPPMIESQRERLMSNALYRMAMQGYDFRAMMDDEQFMARMREDFTSQAENNVKTMLVIEKIVETEAPVMSEEAFEEGIKRFAELRGADVEEYKEKLTDEERKDIEYDVKVRLVIEKMKADAIIVESELEDSEEESNYSGMMENIMDGIDMLYDEDDDIDYEDFEDGEDDDDK